MRKLIILIPGLIGPLVVLGLNITFLNLATKETYVNIASEIF